MVNVNTFTETIFSDHFLAIIELAIDLCFVCDILMLYYVVSLLMCFQCCVLTCSVCFLLPVFSLVEVMNLVVFCDSQ